MKSVDYVKNYLYLYRDKLIDVVKSLRNKDLTKYEHQNMIMIIKGL